MINLAAFNKYTFETLFILVGLVMLQGCGGQRDEPFNPGSPPCSSSSTSSNGVNSSITGISSIASSNNSFSTSSCSNISSSSRLSSSSIKSSSSLSSASASSATVEISLIGSGTETKTAIESAGKKFQVVQESEFNNITGAYSIDNLDAPEFVNGQVILIDDGDVNNCDAHFEFLLKPTTENVGDNSLKVILSYREKPSISPCTRSVSRPYYFYYIKSKKLLAFEDNIID